MTAMRINELDLLAQHGCDTIGYRGGRVAQYDVAGYDRVQRREMAPGQVPRREAEPAPFKPLPAQARFTDQPYRVRVSGFRRGSLFGPDEVGERFSSLGIAWNDGLGNGLYESLLIDRKYGLAHSLEAPILGYEPPFFEADWQPFRDQYAALLAELQQRMQELEPVYGGPIFTRPEGPCVLNFFETPLSLFARTAERDPQRTAELLEMEIGGPLPPAGSSRPDERLALARFWALIRKKHGLVLEALSGMLRNAMGSGVVLIGNYHELPVYSFESLGKTYDHPAVAVRPLLLEDALLLRHYTAYFTQLYHDLTGKSPFVSVRVNLSAAGTRFVPGKNLIQSWYDQAVRHGAGGFYFWPRDYPMDQAEPYDGPMIGNPEPATLPQERWEASLKACGHVATHRRFIPPAAQAAILVPRQAALLHREDWRRIYAAFSACAEARLHCGFLGDWQILRSGVPAGVRLLLAPALEFITSQLRAALESFTLQGGQLWVPAGNLWDASAHPTTRLAGSLDLPTAIFDFFPLGEMGSSASLDAAAAWVRERAGEQEVDAFSWLFDLTCAHLPKSGPAGMRSPEPGIHFRHWLYEHGSNWIYPYIYP